MNINRLHRIGRAVESTEERIVKIRQAIAEQAVVAKPLELAKLVNDLARYNGGLYVVREVKEIVDRRPDDAEILVPKFLLQLLVTPADDTWSGRTNDIRRSYADGVRDAANNLILGL